MVRTTRSRAVTATVAGPGAVAVTLRVNGREHRVMVEPRRSLLEALRLDLGLTGAKLVCNLGECGACTVLVDGEPVNSCIALAIEQQGREILTIEGLGHAGHLDPVQEAFVRADAIQCGYCTPGQVLAAKALLAHQPNPSDREICHGMAGNLCRCGTYAHIRDALRSLRSAPAASGEGGQP
jgi:aerobic-type carbon monoxide dehydrogenase small subunit (CoxS/CutS family)